MTRVLISFLGGGRFFDKNTGKPKDYNKTNYRFPDGWIVKDSRFFGLEVVTWKAQTKDCFDQVVLAGTTTSMWDLFAERLRSDNAVQDELLIELMDRCEPRTDGSEPPGAERRHLDALEKGLSGWSGVDQWKCIDLPYGKDAGQQMDLLDRLAVTIPEGAELWLDITHGFRIFPMFALALAQILSSTRCVKVHGILYGAYDMRDADNLAPVLDLSGLLRLQQWTNALAAFEEAGTLIPFVSLLKEDGARLNGQVEKLREITVAERANSLHRVRETRKHVSEGLEKDPLPAGTISSLFAMNLKKAVQPYPQKLSQAQRGRAMHFLKHDDILQATILCHEGLVSRAVEKEGHDAWTVDYKERERIAKIFNEDRSREEALLNSVRNSLAHGTASSWPKAEELRRNLESLKVFLDRMLRDKNRWE